MCGRSQGRPWVSAASFLYWVGHRIFLPLVGLQDRQMQDLPVILFWLLFFLPLNPLEKGMGRWGQTNPNPQSHFGNVVIEALLTSRCLLELTAVPKLLGFGESSA